MGLSSPKLQREGKGNTPVELKVYLSLKSRVLKWIIEHFMDRKRVFGACLRCSKVGGDGFYPMYFGISCALFALESISEKTMDDERWLDTRSKMLQGSAHLLGLLIWRVQTEEANASKNYEIVQNLEKEIQRLKKMRSEDAKANEKVVGIFAAQEQRWFSERKNLRQQVNSLLKDMAIFERRKHEETIELNSKLQEMEMEVKSKCIALGEEGKKKKDLEERMKGFETQVEKLREASKHETQAHASELLKHKSAFIEVVSSQRHLEAELGRALRQVEIAKQQLGFVFEEKEELMFTAQKLSIELERVTKDSEQKDKVLSAMLRKSKLDTAEKHMLLKEAKLSEALRKQAETEKWRMASEPRNERHTFRSMLTRQVSSRLGNRGNSTAPKNAKLQPNDFAFDYGAESAVFSPRSHADVLPESDNELDLSTDVKRLDDGSECLQTRKYKASMEQRHQLELEAFSEQIRLKDEKLEAYHWRLLSTELESKRLTSQIEGLNKSISQLRHDKLKLETMLVERETELKTLQDQISMHLDSAYKHRNKLHGSSRPELPLSEGMFWSNLKIIKRKHVDKEESKKNTVESGLQVKGENESVSEDFTPQSLVRDDQKGPKEVHGEITSSVGADKLQKESTRLLWKMDIHALGISYKIKRLHQQLMMLERLAGKKGNAISGESEDPDQMGMKDFPLLLGLLNKQVSRYRSLQEKTDEMYKRMDLKTNEGDSRTKEESRRLEQFLEETFQLQRFIVATGQKLMEIQSKFGTAMAEASDTKGLCDNIQCLFCEVQRGIEVRISRIIGDVGGTLACDGFRSRGH